MIDLLEPHPLHSLPIPEDIAEVGEGGVMRFLQARAAAIAREKDDPLHYGFKPAIWDLVDDLLVDGNKVVLDLTKTRSLGAVNGECEIPKEIFGASEVWIAGSQRSSKSEYAARKCVEIFSSEERTRGWSFADTATISKARQQPIFWKYLPASIKKLTRGQGKYRKGVDTSIGYNLKSGFSDDTIAFEGSQHWFKNYEQDISNVEGDQLDIVWFDELRSPELLKTIRIRMGDRGGIIIATFTSIDDNYSAIVNEYDKGSKSVLEVDAELLPIKDEKGNEVGLEKVPRIKVAGPGSDGDQRANIVYFHISDNPYYGFNAKGNGAQKTYGKERFYSLLKGASRTKILSRAYGVLTFGAHQQFPRFSDNAHVVAPSRIPNEGTNYHIVDPCDGRNWFMIWVRIDPQNRWWIYREWPSFGHEEAYISGIGDPGAWALPGKALDGDRGPAQSPFGFGLERYSREIARLEKNEVIAERWMDSRYGTSPNKTMEGSTTLIEQMTEVGLDFLAASGKAIKEGVGLIADKLDYDSETPIGEFSAALARINQPMMFVSEHCPNTIYSLKEWTGKDKGEGACKDPIDVLRYAALADIGYIGADMYVWKGGGAY